MKVTKFLIIILISLFAFTESPKAIVMSDTYKQGIYNISKANGYNATAKLMTSNNVTSLIIVDANSNEKFYKRFDTVDEIITLGYIKDGDNIVIAGSGEISISYSK